MKPANNIREIILSQPSYWVEGVNGSLYNAILSYMEANNLNRTKLASYLGISKGRVSQILNDGEINFSLQKIIEIALKVGKYPLFEFLDKEAFLEKESKLTNTKTISMNQILKSSVNTSYENIDSETKIV